MITQRTIFAALLGIVFSTGALASWPDEQTYKGITFVSGGIGSTESKEMRDAASRYSLAVTFVGTIGEYLTKVDVKIKNQGGDVVLSTTTEGPILL
ncbi:MAG: carboxypeptidase regulatory-like domain-containing protein, partial [Zoogloea sp.]|nr:carboxypeptidase regulatory-like domain-containing protein [Zoogloea sp.]